MEEEKVKKEHKWLNRKIYLGEIIWYSFFGITWLTGLVLAILGVCAYNVGRISDNPLYKAEKGFAAAFGQAEGTVWDFRVAGTIFMVVAMIGFLIVIFYYTDKMTKDAAERKRKEERQRILMSDLVDVSKNDEKKPEEAAI